MHFSTRQSKWRRNSIGPYYGEGRERPVGRRVHDGSCSFYSYRSDNLAVLRAAASRKKHSGPTKTFPQSWLPRNRLALPEEWHASSRSFASKGDKCKFGPV